MPGGWQPLQLGSDWQALGSGHLSGTSKREPLSPWGGEALPLPPPPRRTGRRASTGREHRPPAAQALCPRRGPGCSSSPPWGLWGRGVYNERIITGSPREQADCSLHTTGFPVTSDRQSLPQRSTRPGRCVARSPFGRPAWNQRVYPPRCSRGHPSARRAERGSETRVWPPGAATVTPGGQPARGGWKRNACSSSSAYF